MDAELEAKQITMRRKRTLNDLIHDHNMVGSPGSQVEPILDEGHRYRYRCSVCGRTGKWYRDGNIAQVMLENHKDRQH